MAEPEQPRTRPTGRLVARVALISFACLFVELMLIRWVSMEVRIFAYLHNLVLLACFLGFGLGCFHARRPVRLVLTAGLLAFLVVTVEMPPLSACRDSGWASHVPGLRSLLESELEPGGCARFHPWKSITDALSTFEGSLVWYDAAGMSPAFRLAAIGYGIVATLVLLALIAALFFPLGQLLGREMEACGDALIAYSVNVGASLLGIWAFTGLSLLSAPPWTWFLAGGCTLVPFAASRGRAALLLALALMTAGVSWAALSASQAGGKQVLWSPYQKLRLQEVDGTLRLDVNDVGYMLLPMDLSDAALARRYTGNKLRAARELNQYDVVFRFVEQPRSVLVLGAGGGNNAAGAVRNGAESIDCVEINPGIVALGRAHHPERPYDDERVHVVVDDARAFAARATQRYDLVVVGLLDSHTVASSYNNVRLDHYVYTRESFRDMRKLLTDDGVLAVVFEAQRPWIRGQLQGLVADAFGEEPLSFSARGVGEWGGDVFVASRAMAALRQRVGGDDVLSRFMELHPLSTDREVALTDDDWPYLYLKTRHVPPLHLIVVGALLVLFIAGRRLVFREGERVDPHFFLLGAAFLLLEFQNVSKTALLFGTTWMVNAIVISAILLLILLANLLVRRLAVTRLWPWYAALLASLLILWILPPATLVGSATGPAVLLVGLLMNLPILFAGVVFATSFARTPDMRVALGSNLFGAAFGGLLEPASFVIGVKALLLVAAALYAGSWWAARRR